MVTGATAGIGRDFALQLAGAGFNIFLASRTASKLEEISAEISTFATKRGRLPGADTPATQSPSILRRRRRFTPSTLHPQLLPITRLLEPLYSLSMLEFSVRASKEPL